MKINCKKCNNEIKKLEFNEQVKLDLYILMQNDLKIFAVKKLVDEFKISEIEAKTIIQHLNNNYGKCVECEFDKLKNEFTECPNCNAFNFNLNEPPFNIDFCSQLEWNLDFENQNDEKLRHFWCDGIEHLPKNIESLLYKNIEKNKEIITKAWIGNSGSDVYEMKIVFGKQSIEYYKNQKKLNDCIPKNNENPNWIKINSEKRIVIVELK